jgi:cell division protein FtsW (lipid II flippase)
VNARLRSVLLGVGVGVGPLLLLDLASTLRDAAQREANPANLWWMLACYVLAGVIVATGLVASRRDRIVPAVALVLVALVVLAAMPVDGLGWLRRAPLVGTLTTSHALVAVGGVAAGAYALALVRGTRD